VHWTADDFRRCFAHRQVHHDIESYVIFQRLERGPVGKSTRRFIAELAPHLHRAVQISQQLANHHLLSEAMSDALNRLPFGVIFIDARRRVLQTSRVADEIFHAADGLEVVDNEIHTTIRTSDLALQRLVTRSVADVAADCMSNRGVTKVERLSGKTPYLLHVAPVAGQDLPFSTARPATLVFLTDPEHKHRLHADYLRQSLGLTATEARLAALLAAGYPVDASAKELGCARSTTRLHLQHIYAKTGLHRQVDLIRLFLTLPPAFHAESRVDD